MTTESSSQILDRERAAGIFRADYATLITPERQAALSALPMFQSNGMAQQDHAATVEFYSKRYLRQLPDYTTIAENTLIADIGCGSGWLAVTLALETRARIVAVEVDELSLSTARELARILGVADRIDFHRGDLSNGIPLRDREADLCFCIEVLEHVERNPACLQELARVTGRQLIATTPNLWFPAVAHDTRLPFAHWLPRQWRKPYARLAGRNPDIDHNLFWSAPALARHLPGFVRRSGFLHYRDLQRFLDSYPFYVPYDCGYWEQAPGKAKLAYYRLVSQFGTLSPALLPNLAGFFERVD